MTDARNLVQQIPLLLAASMMIVLSNVVGFGGSFVESTIGVSIMAIIGFGGIAVRELLSRYINLPSILYISLLGLISASPLSPIRETLIRSTSQISFLAPTTAMGVFAGISLSGDVKEFSKLGWKFVVITLLIITGTYIGSAVVAHVVMNMTGAI